MRHSITGNLFSAKLALILNELPKIRLTMTQERFLKLLDNPDLLASISYEELKTLALMYPYAQNLRYLLAIKSSQDNHPEFARNLAAAAAHSLDRTRLLALVAPNRIVPQMLQEEAEELVLELKPIETVQRELEAKTPVGRQETQSVSLAADVIEMEKELPADEPALVLADLSSPEPPASEREQKPAPEENIPPPEQMPLEHAGAPPSFSVWISQFNPPALASAVRRKQTAPEPGLMDASAEDAAQDPAPLTPQMLAEKSITESKSIVSETLARLYLQQGHRDKAIEMYERLCLAFPEKSAYFAAEIEKLKK